MARVHVLWMGEGKSEAEAHDSLSLGQIEILSYQFLLEG